MARRTTAKHVFMVACAGMLVTAASGAGAQWQWRDLNGRMVISDQAPPAEIPNSNIIKGPGFRPGQPNAAPAPAPAPTAATRAPAAAGGTPATANATATAPGGAPTLADREKDFQKRQQEAAEAAKKAADEAAAAEAKAAMCARMRGSLQLLESGRRILTVNEAGEQSVIDDQGRQDEIQRLQQQMAENCS